MDIPCPIIFLRIGRSRRPQTEALLELKAIFRRSISSLPPALALTRWRPFGSGSVPGIVFLAGFHSLSPTFPLNAAQNRVCPVSSTSIAALASLLFTKDLRLGCFIFIRGRISRDNMRTVPRGKLTRFAREVTRAPSVSSSLIWRQVTAQTQPQRRVLFRGVVLSGKRAS